MRANKQKRQDKTTKKKKKMLHEQRNLAGASRISKITKSDGGYFP